MGHIHHTPAWRSCQAMHLIAVCTVHFSLSGRSSCIHVFNESTPSNYHRLDPLTGRLTDHSSPLPRKNIGKETSLPINEVKCPCGQSFRTQRILSYHLRTCKYIDYSETCFLCPKPHTKCENRVALFKHQYLVHGSAPCADCGRRFGSAEALGKHRASFHIDVECSICGKRMGTKFLIWRHYLVHTRSFQCQKCGKSFGRKRSLVDHVLARHQGVSYRCSDCGKSFTDRANLRMHVQTIHRGVSYKCTHCTRKGYTRKATLRRHMMRVHGLKLK